jgi:hypothetical protein
MIVSLTGPRGVGPRAATLVMSVLVLLLTGSAAVITAAPTSAEGLRRGVLDPGQAPRGRALSRWEDVVSDFERAGDTLDPGFVAADAASALAGEVWRSGWSSPDVPQLVSALVKTANADGGFGLAREWDAYQDGTVNEASTSYTATTAGHVGPVLLAGYSAGVISAAVVTRAMDSLLDLPRASGLPCVPYSNSRHDVGKPCVWNTSFGAASWIKAAGTATGHRRHDVADLIAYVLSVLDTLAPDPATGYFPYSSAQTLPQDIGHQLWTAQAIDDLRGTRDAMTTMISKPLWRLQTARHRDIGVASAMSGIALFDCRYATDPFVLAYAGSARGGTPYAYKALANQARAVLSRCFGRPVARGASPPELSHLVRAGLG